ncbi:molybdate ABC transporter permease subunit [uncultured Actinomyces sp.]|uniref:molybdate ABC transporter permease subunit n=1 Tax=uncultured Actinomyces sp. TaxID=249061 RepID=UPI0025EA55F6|nr:molybdate ABC transporter permease subunit [uncultured Actinomyces sp.]
MLALALLGACAIVLPFVGLGTRVSWTELPTLLMSDAATRALGLSLRTCLIATAISVVLGVPLALLLSRQWPGVRIGRVLTVLPMTMPPVVAGIALLSTLGKRSMLGSTLEALGVQISFTTTAVVIAQVFVSMPYLVVTLEAALRSRDTHAETIARTLGAREWTVLTRITLPLVGPALVRGTALALGRSLGEFGATIAFAGSKEGVTRTMPLAIYLERESDTATSLALAVVLIAMSFIIVGATNVSWPSAVARLPRPPRRGGATPSDPARAGRTARTGDVDGAEAGRRAPRGRDLHVSFASAVRDVDVDLEVGAGRTAALIGPNGSGKSTVCEVVAGLLDADGGRVRLGERLLDGPGGFVPAGRRGVALLSQSPGVFGRMSALDNVAFGPRCRRIGVRAARARARAELAAVGADHLADRRGSQLSGGQSARVALARALATDPALLVLDEPMAALDVTARAQMRALVARRTAEQGLTVLVVTHDILDVTALADDVIVLQEGRVAEYGSAAEVLTAPTSDFAARLTGTSVLTGTLEGDPASPALRLENGALVTGRPGEDWGRAAAGGPGLALVPPDAVALYPASEDGAVPHGSPRNTLTVTVTDLERSGALVTVSLRTEADQCLTAAVTAGAVAELGIKAERRLEAVVKAVQVRVLPAHSHQPNRQC